MKRNSQKPTKFDPSSEEVIKKRYKKIGQFIKDAYAVAEKTNNETAKKDLEYFCKNFVLIAFYPDIKQKFSSKTEGQSGKCARPGIKKYGYVTVLFDEDIEWLRKVHPLEMWEDLIGTRHLTAARYDPAERGLYLQDRSNVSEFVRGETLLHEIRHAKRFSTLRGDIKAARFEEVIVHLYGMELYKEYYKESWMEVLEYANRRYPIPHENASKLKKMADELAAIIRKNGLAKSNGKVYALIRNAFIHAELHRIKSPKGTRQYHVNAEKILIKYKYPSIRDYRESITAK